MFGLIKAGILESMFDGAGGEILWRPEGARWGIGVDAYEVWQRQFDRLLGLQSYKAFTGHVALYYQAPWYNLNFALRAGEYLAGDRGLTVEITRRFSTGVEIGAFATKNQCLGGAIRRRQFRQGHHHPHPAGLGRTPSSRKPSSDSTAAGSARRRSAPGGGCEPVG